MSVRALTDTMLATLAQTGNSAATDELLRRYERLVTGEASRFFIPGGDADDARQEARLGLLKAIRTFSLDRGVPFARYAHMSVRRQLITALKTAQRGKHEPLTDSARTAVNEETGERDAIVDLLDAPNTDPATLLGQRDDLRHLARMLRVSLSRAEAASVILWANGYTYAEIHARVGGVGAKAVDNMLQRARLKLLSGEIRGLREYVCPGCGHETVRVTAHGNARKGVGRPPFCNVCQTRRAA